MFEPEREWTIADAIRFLDEAHSDREPDLPLFPGRAAGRDVVDDATLGLWVRLVERAAARRGVTVRRIRRGRRLLAVAVPGGPALLAVRRRAGDPWRAALASGGEQALEIGRRVPSVRGVGRAA